MDFYIRRIYFANIPAESGHDYVPDPLLRKSGLFVSCFHDFL
jgi:hypothetical protein